MKNYINNKKGISTLFIAVYLALIVVVLISSLFVATIISQSSLADAVQTEQKASQEKIELSGPEGLTTSDTNPDLVESLKVENSGAITVRIKALYIAGQFMFDPETYVAPGDTVWLDLSGANIILNDESLNGIWKLVTERGTSSTELGYNLIYGSDDDLPNKKFYFGPLLLIYDNFYWRSGDGPWHQGWEIPTNTVDVTWRILLQNIDDRRIVLQDTSYFTLVGTESQQNKIQYWYINPNESSLTLEPGNYYYIYYTKNSPESSGGAQPQKILIPPLICTNFLLFNGNFEDPTTNPINPPFGQTIPFEAVRIT